MKKAVLKHYEVRQSTRGIFVVENTEHGCQTIREFDLLTPARKFASKMNKGQGFAGWTPSFMLDKKQARG